MNKPCFICERTNDLTTHEYPDGFSWLKTTLCSACAKEIVEEAIRSKMHSLRFGTLRFKGKILPGGLVAAIERPFERMT